MDILPEIKLQDLHVANVIIFELLKDELTAEYGTDFTNYPDKLTHARRVSLAIQLITLLGAMQHTTFNWTLSYQSMYYMISSCSAWCWIVIWYAHCKYVEQCAEFIEMKLQVIKNDNYLFIYRLHIIIIREPMIRIRVKSSSRQKKYYYILISSEKKPNYE